MAKGGMVNKTKQLVAAFTRDPSLRPTNVVIVNRSWLRSGQMRHVLYWNYNTIRIIVS
jgi:hypothetical protein